MSTLYYESSFSHHGIPGMKWGIRRYQNKDGSLTPRGEKRYQKELQKIAAGQQETRRRLALEQARVKETRKTEQAKMRLKKEQEGLRNDKRKLAGKEVSKREAPKKTAKDFSNEELKAIIDRATLEQRYNALMMPPAKSKVPNWVADIGKTALKNVVSKAAESYGQALGKHLAGDTGNDKKKDKKKDDS